MNKNNKYLFTIRSLTGGGAERVVSVLTSYMANEGYDISIIAYDKSSNDYNINDKVKIYYMPKEPNNIIGKIKRFSDMRILIKKINPDVIIPFVGTVLFVSYIASRPEHIPFIRTVRNSPWNEPGTILEKIMRKFLNKKSKAIMVQNEEQIEYFPVKMKEKIFAVPNPLDDVFIDNKKENYSSQINKIISVGRLNSQKNQELLIRAFANILTYYPDITLDIYGEGKEKEKLEYLIKEMNIENNCFLKGRSNNIVNELINADLFIMTSNFEGMPNALMEAMALGLPCISSDCRTGPKTLIQHNETGILFETGNESELIKHIKWSINNIDKLNQMGIKARNDIIGKYSSNQVANDLKLFLDKI